MAQIEAKSWGVGLAVPEGRRVVNLDDSALRMLESAQHRQHPVQSTYHSFKYHFKPESIDVRKPGKVQPADPPRVVQDGTALDVEQLGSNNEDKHLFTAVEQGTKDLDVFMIFDPTTGAFTMYEADSSVILTYDRAASKAASRARSRTSPSSQPLTIPPVNALPKPATVPAAAAPIVLPTAGGSTAPGSSATPKRAPAPKPKKAKPKPVPVRPPTPPPEPPLGETEEGEVEFEQVPIPEQLGMAMDVDVVKDDEPGAIDEPEGILPWHAVPTTSHKRSGNTQSTFNATDGPDEEVFHFGGSLGTTAREPPRKAQSKSARSGGIVFPKAAPRGRDPPPRAAPPPPPVQQPDLDDDMFEEVVLPGMNDLEAEMMKQLQSDTSSEEEEEEDGGFDAQAFQEAMAQEVSQDETDSDDSDDDSSSEEDD